MLQWQIGFLNREETMYVVVSALDQSATPQLPFRSNHRIAASTFPAMVMSKIHNKNIPTNYLVQHWRYSDFFLSTYDHGCGDNVT